MFSDTSPRTGDSDNILLAKIAQSVSVGAGGGVLTFNSRSGAVSLLSADVTTALGYTPVNKAGDTMSGALQTASGEAQVRFGGATSSFPAIGNSGALLRIRLADDSGYAVIQAGFTQANVADASSNTSPVCFEAYHETTGGAGGGAANGGVSIDFTADSSTTDRQNQARIQTLWSDATHATRTSQVRIQTVLSGTGTEALRISNTQIDARNSAVFAVAGTQVVSTRKTGWTAASGTASRATYDTATVTTEQLAQRVKALLDDLISHGLIGT